MNFVSLTIFQEIRASLIMAFFMLRGVVLEDVESTTEQESEFIKTLISKLGINEYRSFIFLEKDEKPVESIVTKMLVIIDNDLTIYWIPYGTSDGNLLQFNAWEKEELVHPLENYEKSWTSFLVDYYGYFLWNYYFFKILDEKIVKDYLMESKVAESDIKVLMLFATDDYKAFYYTDNGFEYKVYINAKLDYYIFRSRDSFENLRYSTFPAIMYSPERGDILFYEYAKEKYYKGKEK